jgi:hypothetical protein
MKTYTHIIKHLAFGYLFFNLLLSVGCERKPCDETPIIDTIEIANPAVYKKALTSYSGNDTLKFKSETGEIYTFQGEGLIKGYYNAYEFLEDRCNTKLTHVKGFEGYNFKTSNYTSDIEYYVKISANSLFGSDFHIVIHDYDFYDSGSLPPIGHSDYIQGLIINGKTYNNVLKVYRNYDYSNKSFVYYSIENGIIQINLSNGQTLTKE